MATVAAPGEAGGGFPGSVQAGDRVSATRLYGHRAADSLDEIVC
jgi:hypothetical protein